MYTLETDIKLTDDAFFAKHAYALIRRLQSFQMTEAEEVLMRAMCLYSPGWYERACTRFVLIHTHEGVRA